jgi:DNA-binding transcriptional LysR family regulator
LEAELGVRLVDRTTRTFRLTALGLDYAGRAADIVRLADELNRSVRGEATEISGTLRVTSDPLFGEHFLPELVHAFVREHPGVRVEVMLTSRFVDLIEEGFDVAFRVGEPDDASMVATRIVDAKLVFVAAPGYVAERGRPASVEALADHDLIALAPEGRSARWAFRATSRDATALRWVPISPTIRVNHLGLAKHAALEGLGIANLPYFACGAELAAGRLLQVLERETVPFGGVYLVHPPRRLVTARTLAFRAIALGRLARREDLVPAPRSRRG